MKQKAPQTRGFLRSCSLRGGDHQLAADLVALFAADCVGGVGERVFRSSRPPRAETRNGKHDIAVWPCLTRMPLVPVGRRPSPAHPCQYGRRHTWVDLATSTTTGWIPPPTGALAILTGHGRRHGHRATWSSPLPGVDWSCDNYLGSSVRFGSRAAPLSSVAVRAPANGGGTW
jgi:hypothetical protein